MYIYSDKQQLSHKIIRNRPVLWQLVAPSVAPRPTWLCGRVAVWLCGCVFVRLCVCVFVCLFARGCMRGQQWRSHAYIYIDIYIYVYTYMYYTI